MRCPSCAKMVSYDGSEEPEWTTEPEFDLSSLTISASVRVFKSCGECGEELKQYEFEIDHEVLAEDIHKALTEAGYELPDPDQGEAFIQAVDALDLSWFAEAMSLEQTESQEGKGRRAPMLYGFQAEVELSATPDAGDGVTIGTYALADEARASYFEELV